MLYATYPYPEPVYLFGGEFSEVFAIPYAAVGAITGVYESLRS